MRSIMKIFILLGSLALFAFAGDAEYEKSVRAVKAMSTEKIATMVASEIESNVPIRIDSITLVDGAYSKKNKLFVSKRVYPSDNKARVKYKDFFKALKSSKVKRISKMMKGIDAKVVCSDVTMLIFFKKGGSVTYRYVNEKSERLFQYQIKSGDCKEVFNKDSLKTKSSAEKV